MLLTVPAAARRYLGGWLWGPTGVWDGDTGGSIEVLELSQCECGEVGSPCMRAQWVAHFLPW